MDQKKKIIKLLKKNTNLKEIVLEVPPNPKMGDFAFPCFFLSKKLKKNPKDVAENLSKKIKLIKGIKEIKVVGPYLNFFIDKERLGNVILKEILKKITSQQQRDVKIVRK